jgi:hypothetical protein
VHVRTALTLLLTTALLAGCGGSSHPAPPPPKRDPAPIGHLSPAEKAAIVRSYTLLEPLQKSDATPQALRQGHAACGAVAQPNTRLIVLVRKDCLNAVQFFKSLGDVANSPNTPGPYDELAVAVRAIVANAQTINEELSHREITGVCARSIGITQPQVDSLNRAASAAIDAAAAANAGDPTAFLTAQHDLTDALASDNTPEPLPRIKRDCRTTSARPPAPQSRGHRTPHPRRKPHIPQPGEGVKA